MPRVRASKAEVSDVRAQLERAHRRFTEEAKPTIERMRDYFAGKQWASIPATEGGNASDIRRIVANLLFADVKVMLPALALRNPRIFVRPVGATQQMPGLGPNGRPTLVPVQMVAGQPVRVLDAARAQEALVNWRWRQLRINQAVRRALVDALLAPFAIVKVGYTLLTEKIHLEGDLDQPAEELEPQETIRADAPFAVRWSPMDFRVDPDARYPDLSDAQWIAFGSRQRPEDLRRNPRYGNTRDLKGTVQTTGADTGLLGPAQQGRIAPRAGDDESLRVECWEIWDKRRHKRITLCEESDSPLEWITWPHAYRNFPAETLYFTEYPDTLYGPPDLAQVLDQQDVYNQSATMIVSHIKRFLRKYITTRGAFDEKELHKLQQPVDGQIIESDASDPSKSIIAMPDAPIPVDWWQTRVNVRDDHDRISAITDFVRGVAEKVDTATEASFIQSNVNVRTADQRGIVEHFAERISQQILQIDAQTLDLPTAVPVIGADGVLVLGEFYQVSERAQLEASTVLDIEIGSMQPINERSRKRDVLELYSLLRNDPLVDQFELRRRLIPAYRDSIPDVEALFLGREQVGQILGQMQLQRAAGMGGAPRPGSARQLSPLQRPGVGRRQPRPGAGRAPVATPVQPPEALEPE